MGLTLPARVRRLNWYWSSKHETGTAIYGIINGATDFPAYSDTPLNEGMPNTSSYSVYVPSTFAPVLELGFATERMLSYRKGLTVTVLICPKWPVIYEK